MSTESVARRYASAVFEIARDAGTLEKVTQEIDAFAAAHDASADLRALDQLPTVTDEARVEVVRALAGRLRSSSTTLNVVTLLATRSRLAVLPDMARRLHEMTDEHLGILRAEVSAAKPLSEAYLGRLRAAMEEATGKKVVLSVQADPSLIAGLVTRVGDRVIDGSVRGRLDRLAESLRET